MTPDEELEAEIEIAEAEAKAKTKTGSGAPKDAPGWFESGSRSGAIVDRLSRVAPKFEPGSLSSSVVQAAGSGPTKVADELGGALAGGIAGTSNVTERLMKYLADTGPGKAVTRAMLPEQVRGLVPESALGGIGQELIGDRAMEARQTYLGGDTPSQAYRGTRDSIRADDAAAEAAYPRTYTGLSLAASMGLPGVGVTKGAPLLKRAAQFGLGGLAQGTVTGFGNSEAETPLGVLKDTAAGAGTGALTSAVTGPVMSKAADWTGDAFKYLADRAAEKAISPVAGLTDHLAKEGVKPGTLGGAVRESGILRPLGFLPFGSQRGALNRLETKLDDVGQVIGGSTKEATNLASQGLAPQIDIDAAKQSVTDALRQATTSGAHVDAADAAEAAIGRAIENQRSFVPNGAGGFRPLTTTGPTYEGMWGLKSNLQKTLKPIDLSTMDQSMYREGVSGLTENLYSQLQGALPPESFSKLRNATATYGPLRTTEKLLNKAVSRSASQKLVGITDLQKAQLLPDATPAWIKGGAAIASGLLKGRIPSTMEFGLGGIEHNAPGMLRGLTQSATSGVSKAATRPEPNEEDRAAFTRGNGG